MEHLMEETAAALDNDILEQLFVSTQRNNLELCISYSIRRYILSTFNHHYQVDLRATSVIMPMISLQDSQNQLAEKEINQFACRVLSWFPQFVVR